MDPHAVMAAKVRAVESLCRDWLAAADRKQAPEGFYRAEDAAVAAVTLQRAMRKAVQSVPL